MKKYIFSALLLTNSLAQSCNQHALTLVVLNNTTIENNLEDQEQSLQTQDLESKKQEELIKSFADIVRYFLFFTLRSAISD